jgi:DUF971 family protein
MEGYGTVMLKDPLVLIKNICQIDNHRFTVTWSDETSSTYQLSTLQSHCPCAGCFEARKEGTLTVDETVKAIRITSVGRYAMRIQFTRGCSAGIFDFPYLRTLDKELACEKSV